MQCFRADGGGCVYSEEPLEIVGSTLEGRLLGLSSRRVPSWAASRPFGSPKQLSASWHIGWDSSVPDGMTLRCGRCGPIWD